MMIKPSGTPRSQSRIRITSVLLPLYIREVRSVMTALVRAAARVLW